MAYDPDLEPIFESITAQLVAISARLDRLDSGLPILSPQPEPEPVVTPEPEPVVTPEPEPIVQPEPEPEPVVQLDPIWTTLTRSRITIPAAIEVPAGQREIYIPISVDHCDRESFYCHVTRLVNISGGGINVGNAQTQRENFAGMDVIYRWSPGDDLGHYLKLVTKSTYAAGRKFGVEIRVRGLGDAQKGRTVEVTFADAAAHPEMTPQFHRPLRRLDVSKAQRKNAFDPATAKHSDTGFDKSGSPVWRSRLSHGYAQDGNGETGLYMNEDKFPTTAQTPIAYDAAEKALRLHTLAFPTDARPEFESRLFRHQAVIIQGQTMNDVCGVEGVWRMEAKIPIRRYSWPAFWLVGRGTTGAQGSWTQWPPEIDILEKFNHCWGAADTPYTTTFAQHYGNAGSNTRAGTFGSEIEVNHWLPQTPPMNEAYHSWACAIVYDPKDTTKSEVTFFFNDIEVGCHVLHARHQDMKTRLELYPMANIAVKAPGTYTPEQYNTDDGRGHSGDMLVRDIAYYPSGFVMTPWSDTSVQALA